MIRPKLIITEIQLPNVIPMSIPGRPMLYLVAMERLSVIVFDSLWPLGSAQMVIVTRVL